ncbi:ficolin-2-like isoform X2 [Oratosquilla oratoria]|uniref:ficolin-2-like isoform X2 n=1 Tax=Oratosquilla oratoria TaxID=337810 RepID=UPI003F76E0C0
MSLRVSSIFLLVPLLAVNVRGMMPPSVNSVTVSSLMELVGFSPTCVTLALANCYKDNETKDLVEPYFSSVFHQILQNLTETMEEIKSKSELKAEADMKRPRHCSDLKAMGDTNESEVKVYPYRCCPDWGVTVVCDQCRDDGGWTIIQRRIDVLPRLDFYRTWVEYERGFGHPSEEFWLGLDAIHELTTSSLQELRIDMWSCNDEHRYAKYGFFHVGGPETKYVMHCGRYEGGWWYQKCHDSNLNGRYLAGVTNQTSKGITWSSWMGLDYSLCKVEMKIRPAF